MSEQEPNEPNEPAGAPRSSQKGNPREAGRPGKMAEDWHPDHFPTSARPIFRAVVLLLGIIGALCALVYYSSDHPKELDQEHRRLQLEDKLLTDEQLEETLDSSFDE